MMDYEIFKNLARLLSSKVQKYHLILPLSSKSLVREHLLKFMKHLWDHYELKSVNKFKVPSLIIAVMEKTLLFG